MKPCWLVLLFLAVSPFLAADEPLVVFVNSNTNSMQYINPVTQEISPSLLKGEFGSRYGNLKDVVVTSDGRTAIVSNLDESKLFFVDISGGFMGTPVILAELDLPVSPLAMVLTPNDRFLLVNGNHAKSHYDRLDGSAEIEVPEKSVPEVKETWCTVIALSSRRLVSFQRTHAAGIAMAVTPDSRTVFMADFINSTINAYSLGDDGLLTLRATRDTSPNRVSHLALSPDGRTLLGVDPLRYTTPLLAIAEDGGFSAQTTLQLPSRGGEGCIFSPDGSRAYYLSIPAGRLNGVSDPMDQEQGSYYGTQIHVLEVAGPGKVSWTGTTIPVAMAAREKVIPLQLLSPNQALAISPAGDRLYLTNPQPDLRLSSPGVATPMRLRISGVVEIAVIDLDRKSEMAPLKANGFPAGIVFTTVRSD